MFGLDVGFEHRGGRRRIGHSHKVKSQESKSRRRKESIAEPSLFQVVQVSLGLFGRSTWAPENVFTMEFSRNCMEPRMTLSGTPSRPFSEVLSDT